MVQNFSVPYEFVVNYIYCIIQKNNDTVASYIYIYGTKFGFNIHEKINNKSK